MAETIVCSPVFKITFLHKKLNCVGILGHTLASLQVHLIRVTNSSIVPILQKNNRQKH